MARLKNLIGRSVFEVTRNLPRAMEALQLALAGEALNVVLEMNQRLLRDVVVAIDFAAG